MTNPLHDGGTVMPLTTKHRATVTEPIMVIDSHMERWVRDRLADEKKVTLEGGPYASFNYRAPWHRQQLFGAIYATHGGVGRHKDDAGHTLGLVIIAEGGHELIVGKNRWPLTAGSVFHIDSDRWHSTACADPEGLLAIATLDFGWKEPVPSTFTYRDFAQDTHEAVRLLALRSAAA